MMILYVFEWLKQPHSALEPQYCLQKMHFWRPTPPCNTNLGEHLTKFQQNPLGEYGYIFVLLFTNICDFCHIVFLLCKKNPTKTDKKKYNIAKVADILVYYYCKA